MNKSIKRDWAGLKFKIMQDLGEPTDITFARLNDDEGTVDYFAQTHDKADGQGALTCLLSDLYNSPLYPLQGLDSSKKPTFLKRVIFVLRHLWRQKSVHYHWLLKSELKTCDPAGFSYYSFTEDENKQIKSYCREHATNLNSLILYYLDRRCASLFLQKNTDKRVWMVPVNVREAHELSYVGNYVTALSVYIQDGDTAQSLYSQMRGLLKSGIAWGGKFVANAPKYIGEKRLRKIASSGKVQSPYFGLLSNLGRWDLAECEKAWLVIAPAATPTPIASTLLEVNNKLTFTCQLHPALGEGDECRTLCEQVIEDVIAVVGRTPVNNTIFSKWNDINDCVQYF
jgi:hypothetical protein